MNISKLAAIAASALLLSSCVAGVVARGLGGAALRGGTAAAMRAGGSRVLVSDALVAAAETRGVLPAVLARATANGTRTASLRIGRGGAISVEGEYIATLETASGRIVQGEAVIGHLTRGRLVAMGETGEEVTIGRVVGLTSDKLMGIRKAGLMRSGIGETRYLAASVDEVRNGFYLLRFPNGAQSWVAPGLVALAVIGAADESDDCPAGPGSVARRFGEVITFERCEQRGDARLLYSSAGLVVIDRSDIDAIIPGRLVSEASQGRVTLPSGEFVWGRHERDGEILRVTAEDGPVVVADVGEISD
jgi:hypothetical protein